MASRLAIVSLGTQLAEAVRDTSPLFLVMCSLISHMQAPEIAIHRRVAWCRLHTTRRPWCNSDKEGISSLYQRVIFFVKAVFLHYWLEGCWVIELGIWVISHLFKTRPLANQHLPPPYPVHLLQSECAPSEFIY